ncbi:Cobalt-zinc-cadmium resistance protein CzcD [Marinobacterium lacunae]|uniref:Cobalt-zinc-cadmium resistance protein CzcD n=1 Tax=Marinobacterium lacunae TaxID=1232683 RepID=A0A081FVX4_9GAMM|nr:cation transporter [Marinobacterium lacunae]KEA62679.1 Cobalt-zinc-cadmium resistance protein CzcD [Marinobacterium lacunae]
MSNCGCGAEQADRLERKTLLALLSINAFMFVVELTLGWFAQSTGLIADSLDMLADASVYGLSLYAVGKGIVQQAKAARVSGYLQIILGLGVLFEALRRLLFGSEPQSTLIVVVGAAALVANVLCLVLISKHREGGVHMRASWIFSTNDVIANLGVMLSGVLVAVLGSRYPDLVVGAIISIIVIRGGITILREAGESLDPPKCA